MKRPIPQLEHIQFEIAQGCMEPEEDCYKPTDTEEELNPDMFETRDEHSNRFTHGQSPHRISEENYEWFMKEEDDLISAETEAERFGLNLWDSELPFTPPADDTRPNTPPFYEAPAVNEWEEILFDYTDSLALSSAKAATRLRRTFNRRAKQKAQTKATLSASRAPRKSIIEQKEHAVRFLVEDIEENLADRYEWRYEAKTNQRVLALREAKDISSRNDDLVRKKDTEERVAELEALRKAGYAKGIAIKTDSDDIVRAKEILARDSKNRKSRKKFNLNRNSRNWRQITT